VLPGVAAPGDVLCAATNVIDSAAARHALITLRFNIQFLPVRDAFASCNQQAAPAALSPAPQLVATTIPN
jgi:hypothetical protein